MPQSGDWPTGSPSQPKSPTSIPVPQKMPLAQPIGNVEFASRAYVDTDLPCVSTVSQPGNTAKGIHPRGAFPPGEVNKPLVPANPPPSLPRHTKTCLVSSSDPRRSDIGRAPPRPPSVHSSPGVVWLEARPRYLAPDWPTGLPLSRRAGPGAQGRDLPSCLVAARRPNDAAISHGPEHSCPSVASEPGTASASVAHRWVAAGHGAAHNVGFHAVADGSKAPTLAVVEPLHPQAARTEELGMAGVTRPVQGQDRVT